jgi:hypothetical protein
MPRPYVVEYPNGKISFIEGCDSIEEARELHARLNRQASIPSGRVGDPTYQYPSAANVTYIERVRVPTAQELNAHRASQATMMIADEEVSTLKIDD